jgi:hypothetical protein
MVHSAGFTVDNFFIPPFTVQQGEILIIDIDNGPHFVSLRDRLVNIFLKRESDGKVFVNEPFRFVSSIEETVWQRFFKRLTVKDYIENASSPDSSLPNEIYDIAHIKPKTKIIELAGTPRKILSVLCSLSWSDKIIFDLLGVDPLGAEKIFILVKNHIGPEGCAILIDGYDDFKNSGSKYVKAIYTGSGSEF